LEKWVAGLSRKKKSQSAFAEDLSARLRLCSERPQTRHGDRSRRESYEAVMAASSCRRKVPKIEGCAMLRSKARPGMPPSADGTALIAVEVFEKLAATEAVAAPSMLSDLHVGRLLAAQRTRCAGECGDQILLRSTIRQCFRNEVPPAAIEARLKAKTRQ